MKNILLNYFDTVYSLETFLKECNLKCFVEFKYIVLQHKHFSQSNIPSNIPFDLEIRG